jgi:hypothetical protein
MLSLVLLAALAQPPGDVPYRWVQSDADPGRLHLYRGDVQVGGYDLGEHYYRPYDGKTWGARTEPPLPPPCFGVASGKIGTGPTYRLNGEPIAPRAAYEAVEKGLDDDGKKLRVSIIGPAAVREKARAELVKHEDFAALRPQVAIRDFAPNHWAMKAGFVTNGQPTIYCQAPDGQVLHRQDDFTGGADALVAALRRARDGYDPRRDPDLRSRLAYLPRYASFAALAGAGVLAGVALRRRGRAS